ncbi:hypothetical protein ACFFUB_11220 [Algimonas porphyrae]|uniref:hypothetical protein n=1 Tax=Algimonas porphyrae TaxID=1128113 RepID=UPI00352B1165
MSGFRPEDIGGVSNEPPETDFDESQSEFYAELVAQLQTDLSNAQGENKRLRDENLLVEARARLMEPYAKNVFAFVCVYCIGVFVLLLLQGACESFDLSDTVLGIIAGSTAVATLGLVGIVLKGLFGPDG